MFTLDLDYAQQQTDLIELQECPLVGEHKQTETTEEGQQQGSLDSDKEDTKKAEEDEVEEVENPQDSEDEKELAQQTGECKDIYHQDYLILFFKL